MKYSDIITSYQISTNILNEICVMTMKEFTTHLDVLQIPYAISLGRVDIHDSEITPEIAAFLRTISLNGHNTPVQHEEEVHPTYIAGLCAIAQLYGIQMTSWDTELFFKEIPQD
jgi:hypothetical protein